MAKLSFDSARCAHCEALEKDLLNLQTAHARLILRWNELLAAHRRQEAELSILRMPDGPAAEITPGPCRRLFKS